MLGSFEALKSHMTPHHKPQFLGERATFPRLSALPQGRCALRIGNVHLAVQQRLVDD